MLRNLNQNPKKESLSSYVGLLSHGDTHELREAISEKYGEKK
jgi:hypothetical protein